MNQRFNFFVVFFGLCITAAVNAKLQLHLQLILSLGFIVATLFALVLYRTNKKVDLAIKDLMSDRTHPVAIIDSRCGGRSFRFIIGIVIPMLCLVVLFAGSICSLMGVLKVASAYPPDHHAKSKSNSQRPSIQNIFHIEKLDVEVSSAKEKPKR